MLDFGSHNRIAPISEKNINGPFNKANTADAWHGKELLQALKLSKKSFIPADIRRAVGEANAAFGKNAAEKPIRPKAKAERLNRLIIIYRSDSA